MKEYNGHRNYNAWNVSLWISNDEPLYNFALECLRRPMPLKHPVQDGNNILAGRKPPLFIAVRRFMWIYGTDKTPDGVPYTSLNVKLALAGLED